VANNHPGSSLWKALMLLCFGFVLIAIGFTMGGQLVRGWAWPWNGGHWGWESHDDSRSSGDWGDDRIEDLDDDSLSPSGTGSSSSRSGDYERLSGSIPATVRTVDIHLKAAALTIRTGTEFSYSTGDFERGDLRVSSDDARFSLEERDWSHFMSLGPSWPKREVTLTIPADMPFADFSVMVGAGSVRVDALTAKRLSVETGAGQVRARNLRSEDARLQAGAGSLDLVDCAFVDSRFEAGAGSIRFSGELTGDARVETGAGSVNFTVVGSEDDYRIRYERGLGTVRIGGSSFTGVGDGEAGSRDATRTLKLSAGIGSVVVDFKK